VAAFPIIVFTTPVSITTDTSSLTYQQLLSTLNYTVYDVKKLTIQAQSINQVSKPYQAKRITPDGRVSQYNLPVFIDPSQYQAVVDLAVEEMAMIITLLFTLSFTILPGESISFEFDCDSYSPSYWLNQSDKEKNNLAPEIINNQLSNNDSFYDAFGYFAAGIIIASIMTFVFYKPKN